MDIFGSQVVDFALFLIHYLAYVPFSFINSNQVTSHRKLGHVWTGRRRTFRKAASGTVTTIRTYPSRGADRRSGAGRRRGAGRRGVGRRSGIGRRSGAGRMRGVGRRSGAGRRRGQWGLLIFRKIHLLLQEFP